MRRSFGSMGFAAALLAILIWMAGPALADKPSEKGNGNGNKHENGEYSKSHGHGNGKGHSGSGGGDDGYRSYFTSVDRNPIDAYYSQQFQAGHCPPGLAKKGNGCQPPGQAKKWALHQPLPSDVAYYEVPVEVSVHLGVPPAGHRYVRVAQDILLIATGTGMVVDAMQDLGRTLGH